MKPIVISTWTLLFPRRRIDMDRGGAYWPSTLRTYPSRKAAQSEAESFESWNPKTRWPRPVKIKITVEA